MQVVDRPCMAQVPAFEYANGFLAALGDDHQRLPKFVQACARGSMKGSNTHLVSCATAIDTVSEGSSTQAEMARYRLNTGD